MDAYSILNAVQCLETDAVLATILSVNGHSYRKAGAMMVFSLNGCKLGSISPGCLEADLQERIDAVNGSGKSEIISYNMQSEEDPVWGESIGCGGAIRVLLEPIDREFRKFLSEALARMNSGRSVHLVRTIYAESIQYSIHPQGDVFMTKALTSTSQETDPAGGAETMRSDWVPKSRLLLFGGGNDAQAICRIAQAIDFQVIVADWRVLPDAETRYPGAQLVSGTGRMITRQLGIGCDDYLIICSHHLQRDREMLEQALPLRPKYIGVLGSQSRISKLFEGFAVTANVYAPVGLAIGADGPEEIAVSVAAELVSVRARARNECRRGVRLDEDCGVILGGWSEPKNGGGEAAARAVAGHYTRE
ncbi:XdhC family protein [Paenibacillus solisilvae]|uniref:XdhC family protein n=1 Tax=Paenibacillus solisilvae TaxID=2486751 RepID=A0ABW0VRE5_9BACL